MAARPGFHAVCNGAPGEGWDGTRFHWCLADYTRWSPASMQDGSREPVEEVHANTSPRTDGVWTPVVTVVCGSQGSPGYAAVTNDSKFSVA